MRKPRYTTMIAAAIVFFLFFPFPATAEDGFRFIGEIYYEIYAGPQGPSASERKAVQAMCFKDQCLLFAGEETGNAFINGDSLIITLYGSRISGNFRDSPVYTPPMAVFYVRYMEVGIRSFEGICTEMFFQQNGETQATTTTTNRFPVRIILPNP